MNKSVFISVVVAVFCATFAAAKPEKQVVPLKSIGVETELRAGCLEFVCNNSCRLNLWQGGWCINGICYCWRNTYANTVAEEKNEVASLKSLGGEDVARACNNAGCNAACKNIGWKGGFCNGADCWCWR